MIVLTDTATDKVRSLMEQEGVADLALRVAVRPGGCSGFSYEMFFDTDVADDDKTLDYSGVKVVVDPSSAIAARRAPRSTTRTGCRAPGSPSTTPTPSAPAAAVRASADLEVRWGAEPQLGRDEGSRRGDPYWDDTATRVRPVRPCPALCVRRATTPASRAAGPAQVRPGPIRTARPHRRPHRATCPHADPLRT